MLRTEAVSAALLETLNELMQLRTLRPHRLVGDTALALQLGHRISVDIDLFSDKENDFEAIQTELVEKFRGAFAMGRFVRSSLCKGITVYINNIKTDILDWNSFFIRPELADAGIRLASKEDITPMKFNTFLCAPELARYEKKDFVDIAHLMKEYSLDQMIRLYQEKYPHELMSSRLVIEGLQLIELADKKIMPQMLNGETWIDIKNQIRKSIDLFLRSKLE